MLRAKILRRTSRGCALLPAAKLLLLLLPAMASAVRLARLKPETTVLLICDVQEKFRSGIQGFAAVVSGSQRMLRAAGELKVPAIVTEQYPKGLGHTVSELDTSAALVVHKTDFSMAVPEVKAAIGSASDAVIVGLEAHVCVQQTSLDLLEMGLNVHLCIDAVSSQTLTDRSCGLHRAAAAGAHLTTTESVLFELIRSKDHPSFKAISTTVKETRPEQGLPFMSSL